MKIVVLGSGVQGTLYGVRLAGAGHDVTLIARGARAVELREQPTAIQARAPDIAAVIRFAGFRTELIRDMDSWLRRHAIFVTSIAGALYEVNDDSSRLASDSTLVRTFVLAIREGWASLDRRRVAPAPIALRAVFAWVPLPFAIHTRHTPGEMAALADDVRSLIENDGAPHLRLLYRAIDKAAGRELTTQTEA